MLVTTIGPGQYVICLLIVAQELISSLGFSSEQILDYIDLSELVISKILERHLLSVMTTHLNTNSPLSSQQWGFTAGKSTTAALVSFSHDCLESLDGGKEMCSVFFDLSKAFDSVHHLPLLNKLKQIGLNPFITKAIYREGSS